MIDDPLEPAIKLDSTTNGEYWPRPIPRALEEVRASVISASERTAPRLGMSRRDYLLSSCGAAATLLGLNQLGCGGGRYSVPSEAAHDAAAANAALSGNEWIFDVQTHFVSADRQWWATEKPNLGMFLTTTPQAKCGAPHWAKCFDEDDYIREIFVNSDTSYAVISALWGDPNPINVDEAAQMRDRVAELRGGRVLLHGGVYPNAAPFEKISEEMQRMAEDWKISAWKLYPVWGPEQKGYFLDSDLGMKTIARGLELGVSTFAVHKGLPLPGMDPQFTRPIDVGNVARQFPKATFLIYHSGYEDDRTEGPYDPAADRGVDALIASIEKSKATNVYAELGSVWREVLKKPDEAAHVMGKLLQHLGEDRILWGTDGIWYGSPQDQIAAFRAFEISPEYRDRFAYPALTRETKAKIFGLNAANVYRIDPAEIRAKQKNDTISQLREESGDRPAPEPRTYGPRTRREMVGLLRREKHGI